MKVILQQDVRNLGDMGDIVRVKDGYARNFLLPRGMVIIANEKNTRQLDHFKRMAEAKAEKEKQASQELAKKLENTPISFEVKIGEDDRVFGSVTNKDIVERLAENGFELERKNIQLPSPLKTLGSHKVKVSLNRGVSAELEVYLQK
jgi:large subunit ribosomal protein L9